MKTFKEFVGSAKNIALDEIHMIISPTRSTKNKPEKPSKEVKKPNPNDPEYVRKYREYIKSKQRQEAIDYVILRSGAEAANERAAAEKKAKKSRQQSDADAARHAFRTKGIPFSDAKGSGHIRNGVKHYDS